MPSEPTAPTLKQAECALEARREEGAEAEGAKSLAFWLERSKW